MTTWSVSGVDRVSGASRSAVYSGDHPQAAEASANRDGIVVDPKLTRPAGPPPTLAPVVPVPRQPSDPVRKRRHQTAETPLFTHIALGILLGYWLIVLTSAVAGALLLGFVFGVDRTSSLASQASKPAPPPPPARPTDLSWPVDLEPQVRVVQIDIIKERDPPAEATHGTLIIKCKVVNTSGKTVSGRMGVVIADRDGKAIYEHDIGEQAWRAGHPTIEVIAEVPRDVYFDAVSAPAVVWITKMF